MEEMRSKMEDLVITVLGLGFVGLTTASGFASKGFNVIGYDIDEPRLNLIKQGIVPFHEPNVTTTGIKIADSLEEATKNSHIIFLCVGTPQADNGAVDLSYIEQALLNIKAPQNCLVVIKSTVPPGTTANLKSKYKLANNPEFLREGYAWEDFINPDRIVCGVTDDHSKNLLEKIYKPFDAPIYFTNLNTAEFIKYLSNTMLATMISYANEMSIIADSIGDIHTKEAFSLLHKDKRLAGSGISSYIYPGAGYGGYCLPKDTKAMAYVGGKHSNILNQVIATNETMLQINLSKITKHCKNKDTAITILGLSFKPNSDDVRDSVSAKIIKALLEQGYKNITAYDPLAMDEFNKHYQFDIKYMQDTTTLGQVVVIATAWEQFKTLDYTGTKLVDLRYII